MWIGGLWRKICQTSSWGEKNDQVVCRQLGFGPPLSQAERPSLYAGNELVRTHNMSYNCSGNEEMLTQCQHDMLNGEESCDSTEYVFVHCSGKLDTHCITLEHVLLFSKC